MYQYYNSYTNYILYRFGMSTSITLVYMVHKVNVFSTRLIVNDLLLGILLCKSSTAAQVVG